MYLNSIILSGITLAASAVASTTQSCTGVLKSPRPPYRYCGSQGVIQKPQRGKQFNGIGFLACADACITEPSYLCGSFAYDYNGGYCQLYTSRLQNMAYKPGWNHTLPRKWNRACFTSSCTDSCPQSVSVVTNNAYARDASFEDLATNDYEWGTIGNVNFLSTCNGTDFPYDGLGFSQLIAAGDINMNPSGVGQYINDGGYNLNVAFYYRPTHVSGNGCSMYLGDTPNPVQIVALSPSSVSSYYQWSGTNYRAFPFFQNNQLFIYLQCSPGSQATVDLDAVVVTRA